MVLHHLLLLPLVLMTGVQAVLSPPSGYDDDTSPLPLRLEDLEREQEQPLHQLLDVNQAPLLPNRYEWRPEVAASLPPSYIQHAAQRELELERLQRLEELRQLQRQHQQLSAGYAFPARLPGGVLFVDPTAATPTPTPSAATTVASSSFRLTRPIKPYDLDLGHNGIQYVSNNELPPLPVPRPLPPPHNRPPFIYGFTQGNRPTNNKLVQPLVVQQSKQFAYAPAPPPQRHYANGPRIPLPYPPSFVSITTRRPGLDRVRPFRPSQPDPTPDLFAGRSSKSLLDSYIPSWEVLRLIRERSPQQGFTPIQRQTLAYPAPTHLRLYKRDFQVDRTRSVKKSLGQPENTKTKS
ncbi:uncharacterized protein LOC108118508 [Drosophila eugracilis]|uniref:uncharacterized protein LOC108118508 n=1 Tax=Drosophila eugracilis TaxID=29029 RepID=UPI0007E87FAF|nr:uncharacterized protein LOC108118508 [Drosophila eugracilis]XP_017086738.1 uncharacterized protein LOC108118508 [Drosophila eugracilis]